MSRRRSGDLGRGQCDVVGNIVFLESGNAINLYALRGGASAPLGLLPQLLEFPGTGGGKGTAVNHADKLGLFEKR